MKAIENDFVLESLEDIEKADNYLVQLENNPQDLKKLDEIFRIVHTIKGTSGFFDMKKLSLVANSCENILSSIRSNELGVNTAVVSQILESLDEMKKIIIYFQDNLKEPDKDYQDLIEKNKEILHKQAYSAYKKSDKTKEPEEYNDIQNFRIRSELLEKLVQTVTDLVVDKNYLQDITSDTINPKLHEAANKLSYTITQLQEQILAIKLQPISIAWVGVPRLVRNLAVSLNKKVKITFKGEQTSLDRALLEKIKDPIVHIIRNAMDHGIELPSERAKKGKQEEGSIILNAFYEKGHVVINISDDGAGINIEEIKAKAVERKLASRAELDKMTDKEIFQFILRPGFSTSKEISETSGRGVGMEVVEKNIEELHGSLDIDSEKDMGTVITLNIPLTLALVKVLIVKGDNKKFGIPEINVQEVIKVNNVNYIEKLKDKKFISYGDKLIPCKDINETLNFANASFEKYVVICRVRGCDYGFIVDEICNLHEVTLRPLPKIISLKGIYQGVTVFGDNEMVMILNINHIMQGMHSTKVEIEKEVISDELKNPYLLVNDNSQAIPIDKISNLLEIKIEDIKEIEGEKVINIQNELFSVLSFGSENESITKAIVIKTKDKKVVILVNNISKVINAYELTDKKNIILFNNSVVEVIDIDKALENLK